MVLAAELRAVELVGGLPVRWRVTLSELLRTTEARMRILVNARRPSGDLVKT